MAAACDADRAPSFWLPGGNRVAKHIEWWKAGVVYQVHARSFQDSDGDGAGDRRGIESRLDDVVVLGVDAIAISPI